MKYYMGMGIKNLNYQLTISTIIGMVFFLMSANFAFGQAFTLDPNTLNNEARKLIASHNFQEALDLLDKALEINPEHVDALYNKGWALVGLEKQEEAIVWFDRVLALNPNYIHALNMKGNALLGLDKPEEAIVWYDKALEVDPKYSYAQKNKILAQQNLALTKIEPADYMFEWSQLLILVPIVFGMFLIQHFRKKSRKKVARVT